MKKLTKIKPELPLTFIGLKVMNDNAIRVSVPVFPTERHNSPRVPRKSFYKPISRVFYD